MAFPKFMLSFLLALLSISGMAQLSGSNLFEFQLGNLPDADPPDLSAHYDQLNLQYRYKSLKATVRYEQFLTQTPSSSYTRLTQYTLQYRKEGLDIKVGNFSEILGNGLLLRAYEIPGSVFEEQAYRVRYGFYRDLRGVSVKYNGDYGYVKAVRGRTLANSLPPTLDEDDRRPDLSEGIEAGLSRFGQTAGLVFMRNTNGPIKDSFYSLLLNGNIFSIFSYNFEFAHNIANSLPLFQLTEDARYGIYASLNYSYGNFGLSAEYKDYQDLLIGAGISDPPTLVKEHKYKLLNRSIHVPQIFNEKGSQLEAYYSFRNGSRLLLNYARAVNRIVNEFIFTEYFAELNFDAGAKHDFTVFADYSSDEIKFENNRYTGGFIWEYALERKHSTLLEVEYQSVERNLGAPVLFNNLVVIAGYTYSPNTSIAFTWELSSDPNLVPAGEQRHWIGLDFSQKLNANNTISLFAGQRRGGPACTSGVCYEVLDFEGIEIRFKTKF